MTLYYDFDDDYKNSTTFSLISFINGNKKEDYVGKCFM